MSTADAPDPRVVPGQRVWIEGRTRAVVKDANLPGDIVWVQPFGHERCLRMPLCLLTTKPERWDL